MASKARRVCQARRVRRERPVRWVLLGLLAWLALSVPVALLVGKVLRANREWMEQTGRTGPPVPPGHQAWQAHRESRGPRVIPDRSVPRGHLGRRGRRDHPAK
jgi:hypothetical protein